MRVLTKATNAVLFTLILAALAPAAAYGQGRCEPAEAEAALDVNNVRARIFNNGALFWRGGRALYEVPRGEGLSAMFAAGLWVGGRFRDDLRVAAARYAAYQFWPGPLNDDGTLPNRNDCSPFDRIFTVHLRDLLAYDLTGDALPDVLDWPWQHGAPVVDGDGDPSNYNLEGGDRPEVRGHQTLWWVMNDAGGTHTAPGATSPPINLEVQATLWATRSDDALDNTTFYRYKLIYRGTEPLDSTYVTFFADADLGNADDDYVGSDPTQDLVFIYNADNVDEGEYEAPPPALGIQVLRGPLADDDGRDNDRDGTTDEAGERLGMTSFVGYTDDGTFTMDPDDDLEYYNLMRGRWRDGAAVTVGGDGRTFSGDPTLFMFPGDPEAGAFWSAVNADGDGAALPPGDQRLVVSTGPFRMQPGAEQEVIFAIVWARGADHLASVTALKTDAATVQASVEARFDDPIPPAPTGATRLGSPAAGALGQPTNPTLQWEPVAGSLEYQVQLATEETFTEGVRDLFSNRASLTVADLQEETTYYWRVRGANAGGFGPWSAPAHFSTSESVLIQGDVLLFEDGSPVFVEVAGPGGVDPCDPAALDTDGCDEAGGNDVWFSLNGTGDYSLAVPIAAAGPEERIGTRAPNDFEIRITATGSYAYHLFTSGTALRVPFEVWDIGPTGPFNENNPDDDVQLIPVLYAESLTSQGECTFGYGEGRIGSRRFSDRIYAFYPAAGVTYDDYAAVLRPLIDASPNGCVPGAEAAPAEALIEIDDTRRPLQRVVFVDHSEGVKEVQDLAGTVIRFYTTAVPISPPAPAAPRNRAVSLPSPVTLWWNTPPGTSAFHLQVGNRSFSSLLVDDSTLTRPSFTLNNLPGPGSYYWRLRAQNAFGLWSDWSEEWAFTVGTATATEGPEAGIPETFRLGPNYPNPFNPSTTIRFGVPWTSAVRVTVYDVLGRRVATLVEERLAAGWYTVSWDAQGLSSGVYFYRLEAEGYRQTRPMLLVK